MLLPYVEQGNLYNMYQRPAGMVTPPDIRYGSSVNLPVTTKRIPTYTCPSDAENATWNITHHNYVGNFGNTTRWRTTPYGTDSAGNPNRFTEAPFRAVGATTTTQNIKFSDIIDGLSNTLLFGETVQGRAGDLRGFAWWGGGCHFETYLGPNSAQPDELRLFARRHTYDDCVTSDPRNPPCTGPTSTNPESIAARSRHPGGVQVAMCDGSCRFISDTIALDTWRWLGTGAGKEVLGQF